MTGRLIVVMLVAALAGCSYVDAKRQGDGINVKAYGSTPVHGFKSVVIMANKGMRLACAGVATAPEANNEEIQKLTMGEATTDLGALSTVLKGMLEWVPRHSYQLITKCSVPTKDPPPCDSEKLELPDGCR